MCVYPTRRRGECRISGFSVNSIAFARPKPEAGFTVFLVACVSIRLPTYIETRYPASILYPREEKWCAIHRCQRSLRSRGRCTLEIFIRLPRGQEFSFLSASSLTAPFAKGIFLDEYHRKYYSTVGITFIRSRTSLSWWMYERDLKGGQNGLKMKVIF